MQNYDILCDVLLSHFIFSSIATKGSLTVMLFSFFNAFGVLQIQQ